MLRFGESKTMLTAYRQDPKWRICEEILGEVEQSYLEDAYELIDESIVDVELQLTTRALAALFLEVEGFKVTDSAAYVLARCVLGPKRLEDFALSCGGRLSKQKIWDYMYSALRNYFLFENIVPFRRASRLLKIFEARTSSRPGPTTSQSCNVTAYASVFWLLFYRDHHRIEPFNVLSELIRLLPLTNFVDPRLTVAAWSFMKENPSCVSESADDPLLKDGVVNFRQQLVFEMHRIMRDPVSRNPSLCFAGLKDTQELSLLPVAGDGCMRDLNLLPRFETLSPLEYAVRVERACGLFQGSESSVLRAPGYEYDTTKYSFYVRCTTVLPEGTPLQLCQIQSDSVAVIRAGAELLILTRDDSGCFAHTQTVHLGQHGGKLEIHVDPSSTSMTVVQLQNREFPCTCIRISEYSTRVFELASVAPFGPNSQEARLCCGQGPGEFWYVWKSSGQVGILLAESFAFVELNDFRYDIEGLCPTPTGVAVLTGPAKHQRIIYFDLQIDSVCGDPHYRLAMRECYSLPPGHAYSAMHLSPRDPAFAILATPSQELFAAEISDGELHVYPTSPRFTEYQYGFVAFTGPLDKYVVIERRSGHGSGSRSLLVFNRLHGIVTYTLSSESMVLCSSDGFAIEGLSLEEGSRRTTLVKVWRRDYRARKTSRARSESSDKYIKSK